jgi:hypothetical protein
MLNPSLFQSVLMEATPILPNGPLDASWGIFDREDVKF